MRSSEELDTTDGMTGNVANAQLPAHVRAFAMHGVMTGLRPTACDRANPTGRTQSRSTRALRALMATLGPDATE